jgi:uncharacterized protein (DUF1800 family)
MASLTPLSSALTYEQAAHLLRRSSFRVSNKAIKALTGKTISQATAEIFQPFGAPVWEQPVDPTTSAPWINNGTATTTNQGVLKAYVRVWFVQEAFMDSSINHKLVMFLHNCWTVNINGLASERSFDYLQVLKFGAKTGDFKKLALKMTLDGVMMDYLDNNLNTKNSPNENYAREFLELFTIGKGPQKGPGDYTNYTETDIQVAAKLLTGFRVPARATAPRDPETGTPLSIPNIGTHDTSNKIFSAAFGNKSIKGATTAPDMMRELTEFIDMVFDQIETARFIVRRLYMYFVNKNLTTEIETDIIQPLATKLKANGFNIRPILQELMSSVHFFDADDSKVGDEILGVLVKSPMELTLQSLNYWGLKVPDHTVTPLTTFYNFWNTSVITNLFVNAGFDIFQPVDVSGYPAYYQQPELNRLWIGGTTIIPRYKLGEMILTNRRVTSNGAFGATVDTVAWADSTDNLSNAEDAETLVTEVLKAFFPVFPSPERFDYFLNTIFLRGLPSYDWRDEWRNYKATGIKTEVRIPLNDLFKAVMQSTEYQLS